MSRQYRFDCPGHEYLSDVDPCPQCAAADPGPQAGPAPYRPAAPPIDRHCWFVIENEPDHDEFPSVVIAVYDNERAANDHVAALRDENGLADDDEYEASDITWEVEQHTLLSAPSVLSIEERAMAQHRLGEQ